MPDRIVIEIQDWGEAYDLHHFKPPKFDMYQEGGFGLYIINKAIDEIKYIRKEDETNYVYLAQLCK